MRFFWLFHQKEEKFLVSGSPTPPFEGCLSLSSGELASADLLTPNKYFFP